MKTYEYHECWDFEAKLSEVAKNNCSIAKRVIEIECEVSITVNWDTAIHYYPAEKLADVLALSAKKGIISSNDNCFILHDDYIECVDNPISDYSDFEQAVYELWLSEHSHIFSPLYDVCKGEGWKVCYIENAPTSFEIRLLDSLVANKEHDLLEDLAEEKAWDISWN